MRDHVLLLNMNFGAVVPLVCGEEVCAPDHCHNIAVKEYYVLYFVVEGAGVYSCGKQEDSVLAGQFFVVRPNETMYYRAVGTKPWHAIWVGFQLNEPLKQELGELLKEHVVTMPSARRIFEEIAQSKQVQGVQELLICGKIYELFAMWMQTRGQALKNSQNHVLRAKNYIKANYTQDLSVQKIAEDLGLSRSYFSALFRQSEGVSPQDFIVNLRLCKAAQLIEQEHYRPGQAAAACGYSDIFNFSKMFKRKFGVSPGQYGKSQRDRIK